MAPARVIGFGTATLDYRIRTADLGIGYTEKLLAREVDVLGGGAIVGQLEAEGIDCSRVLYDPSTSSPFNLAVYAGEERRRVGGYLLANSLARLSEGEIAAQGSAVRQGDWVIVEIGEIPLESVLLFCRQAKSRLSRQSSSTVSGEYRALIDELRRPVRNKTYDEEALQELNSVAVP